MRITLLMLFIGVCLVSAKNSFSQNATISLSLTNTSVRQAIEEIDRNSDYVFVLSDDTFEETEKIVNVDATDMSIGDVLEKLFSETKLSYRVIGKQVVVYLDEKKEVKASNPVMAPMPQQATNRVSGRILDEYGIPVIGANILIAGTSKGTVSDLEGNFVLELESNSSLNISYIGYITQVVDVGNRTTLSITLQEDRQALSEVVVVGYGVQKKANLTGSVAQVDSKLMENRAVTTIGQALQGQVANLNISVPSGGGDPGTGMDFNIRGKTSLSGGSPFILIDGVPGGDLSLINPNDIESVTVLKDAASSAIYGARAAYGVILVTTKTGAKNSKIKVSYGGIVGQNKPIRLPDQVNSLEFAEAYNFASLNAGESPMFSEEHLARIKAFIQDPLNTPSNVPNPSNPNYWSYATLDNDNVDWIREFFKPSYLTHKHDLSISGGNEKSNFYVGAGFYDQGGLLRYADESYQRLSLVSNLHYEPYTWLSGDVRISFYKDDKNTISNAYDGDIGNWFHLATTRFPNWSLKDPNGHWASTSHIYKLTDGGRGITEGNLFSVTGALQVRPLKGWKIDVDYTYKRDDYQSKQHAKPVLWEYTVDEQPVWTTQFDGYTTGIYTTNYYTLNAYTSYEKEIVGHYFSGMVGYQQELSEVHNINGSKRGLISHDLPSIGVAVGDQNVVEDLSHWANLGIFMRFNYNYKEKYLIEFNGRYDGSSKFPSGNRYGFFPSISAGYNIGKEEFWPIKDFMSDFKLRASWGTLGNQDVINYLYLSSMSIGTKFGYIINGELPSILHAPQLVSPDLTWETSETLDLGFDATMLSNRLNVSFDWYNRRTLDMFGPANPLPSVLGADIPQQNNADLSTKGFEVSVNWRDRVGEVDYSVGMVLSDNKTKITRYNNPENLIDGYYVGRDLSEIWGYETAGIIQTDEQLANMDDQSLFYGRWGLGDVMYKDLDGDNKITYGKRILGDTGDYKIIGNSNPRFAFGITGSAAWRGFDLNIFLQGIGKRDFAPPGGGNAGVLFWGFVGGWGTNLYRETMDFWSENNRDAYYPIPYNSGEAAKNQQVQTRYLQNAAYLRLKNFQLGYTLPTHIMEKIKLQRIRFYLSGENLLTISGLHKNFDPETLGGWANHAGKTYPITKSIALGVNIDF